MKKEYIVDELAIYFGVNALTINTWINDGRFIGAKEEDGQFKIPINGLWFSRTGGVHSLKDIVEEFEADLTQFNGQLSEKELLQNQIAAFAKAYHGSYKETLGEKPVSRMTAQEESDNSLWRYLERKMDSLK